MRPGATRKIYSEYERNGVADVFMIFESLASRRKTIVAETRTAIVFANVLKFTSDKMFPLAEKITVVTDNLNTHLIVSLYKAFALEEARRLANWFEWHYTTKHGNWIDLD